MAARLLVSPDFMPSVYQQIKIFVHGEKVKVALVPDLQDFRGLPTEHASHWTYNWSTCVNWCFSLHGLHIGSHTSRPETSHLHPPIPVPRRSTSVPPHLVRGVLLRAPLSILQWSWHGPQGDPTRRIRRRWGRRRLRVDGSNSQLRQG